MADAKPADKKPVKKKPAPKKLHPLKVRLDEILAAQRKVEFLSDEYNNLDDERREVTTSMIRQGIDRK